MRTKSLVIMVAAMVFAVVSVTVPKHLDASIELPKSQIHSISEHSEIVISGHNGLDQPAIIILRADDEMSPPYYDRANIERKIPPGPFRFRIPAGLLKTPKGRQLIPERITRIMAFSAPASSEVMIASLSVEQTAELSARSEGVIALDFGSQSSPVFPGFSRVTPDASILGGSHRIARFRPGTDTLISDGISGIERISLQVPPGRWTLALWTEDPGEWEYMPHFLERRIRVNGRTIHSEKRHSVEWISEVYLRGRDREWRPGQSGWRHLGQHRGGRFTATVEATDGKLIIELAGDRLSATHIAGLLLYPSDKPDVLAQVEEQREVRFNESWRVAQTEMPRPHAAGTSISLVSPKSVVAPGTVAFVQVTLTSSTQLPLALVDVAPPKLGEYALPVTIFAGHWRLTRTDAGSTLLRPDDRHLRGDITAMTVGPALPRNVVLAITVPGKTRPGIYTGSIGFNGRLARYVLEVLDVTLPPATASIGIYLDHAPVHAWFGTDPSQASRCALRTFRWLGMTAVAPPFETPRGPGGRRDFQRDLDLVQASGIRGPYLAYTPLKRLIAAPDWRQALPEILKTLGNRAPEVIWSAADEVSNLGGDHAGLRARLNDIRNVAPSIRLAGHLNATRDQAIVDAFDLVLINSGFGLTARTIARAKREAESVFLYNMERPRLAAGLYLWRSGLDGYLQWHATMSTADPFDPTDGREADIAWLYPTPEPCPIVPDIDRNLIAMAEGVTDFRWLRWLDQKALRNAKAARLRDAIRHQVDIRWNHHKNLKLKNLMAMRADIIDMARALQ